MPRIDDVILESVIYLYPTRAAAEAGEKAGGSGFLVMVRSEAFPQLGFIYAVTNSHVVREGMSSVIRLNTKTGVTDVLELAAEDWIHHPDGDDLAVAPLSLAEQFRYKAIPDNFFLTQDIIKEHDIGPGDELFLVGRFITHEGRQRNLPSVRMGIIAQMPWEPLHHPRGTFQESFLVELRSIGGHSGAPVFVYIPGMARRPQNPQGWHSGAGPWLLGVDWGHLPLLGSIEVDGEERRGWHARYHSGMAGVVPAWKLRQLLDLEELAMQRKDADDQRKRELKENPVELDIAPLTTEGFLKTLKKVSRYVIPSEPDQASPETSE